MEDEDKVSSCRLLLIRHGETVDNIKGLYAGVRDSALTSHGVQQTQRLGQYLAKQGFRVTHLFSSNLSRAAKTAENVRLTQDGGHNDLNVVQLECLREQDFGFYEGKPFYMRTEGSSKSGKEDHRQKHKDDPGFRDVESKESMKERSALFVKDYLDPILDGHSFGAGPCIIAIISHGMLLSALWKVLLGRQTPGSVTVSPECRPPQGTDKDLEHLGGWSNTGYLDITLTSINHSVLVDDPPATRRSWQLRINDVNKKEHLNGLKRTRGGVGSAQHDETQQSIDTFFKKPRIK